MMFLNARLIASTFVMIFLAELGDKTQISTFALASESRSRLSVFLGASSALVLTSLLAVVLGAVIGRYVPTKLVKIVSAAVFLAFGVLTLIEAFQK
jgi:putative Ca2+/H+ antiporter (TMEM165/GDT1 family)